MSRYMSAVSEASLLFVEEEVCPFCMWSDDEQGCGPATCPLSVHARCVAQAWDQLQVALRDMIDTARRAPADCCPYE